MYSKTRSKNFSDDTTLKEIVEWVKMKAGLWNGDVDLLTNPQIIGIALGGK